MRLLCPMFDSSRMVRQYVTDVYLPAAAHFEAVSAANYQGAKDLASWRSRVQGSWDGVKVDGIEAVLGEVAWVGETAMVTANIHLGELNPADIKAEIIYGRIGPDGTLEKAGTAPMSEKKDLGGGAHVFQGSCPFARAGKMGFTLRVTPAHAQLNHPAHGGRCLVVTGG